MELSRYQLIVMKSLGDRGWEANTMMRDVLLRRCSCSEEEWNQLLSSGLVEEYTLDRSQRYRLTEQGKKTLKIEKKRFYL